MYEFEFGNSTSNVFDPILEYNVSENLITGRLGAKFNVL